MDVNEARRRLVLTDEFFLPSEYEKIEYAKSDGNSYVLTDVYPSNDIGFDVTFWTESSIGEDPYYGCIFGSRYSSGHDDFQITTYTNSAKLGIFRFGSNPSTGGEYDARITRLTKQRARLKNLIFTAPDNTIQEIRSYSWNAQILYPVTLFKLNNAGTTVQGGRGCRIYKAIFFNNSGLYREYIPCIRKSDDKVGMYERTTKQFLLSLNGDLTAPT